MLSGRSYSFMATFTAIIVIIVAAIVLIPGAQGESTTVNPAPSVNQHLDGNDEALVINLVRDFGNKLKDVSLLAPAEIVSKSIEENYGDFISPALLVEWQNNPENAPGRLVSSPWPERIEILGIKKLNESSYEVKGEIVEMTSVEVVNGGAAAKRPIGVLVEKIENRWLITALTLGEYENPDTESDSSFVSSSSGV